MWQFLAIWGIQFLVPIRSKYAIGLSVKPVNDLKYLFQNPILLILLRMMKNLSTSMSQVSGGVMSSTFALSVPTNSECNIAYSLIVFLIFQGSKKLLY